MVAHGDIDYAVCDESIARAAADSIPQIDINTAISFTQFYSWAVSKQSPALLDSLNTWLDKFQKEERYQKIYKKYYDKEITLLLYTLKENNYLFFTYFSSSFYCLPVTPVYMQKKTGHSTFQLLI